VVCGGGEGGVRPCRAPGCPKPSARRGLCWAHAKKEDRARAKVPRPKLREVVEEAMAAFWLLDPDTTSEDMARVAQERMWDILEDWALEHAQVAQRDRGETPPVRIKAKR